MSYGYGIRLWNTVTYIQYFVSFPFSTDHFFFIMSQAIQYKYQVSGLFDRTCTAVIAYYGPVLVGAVLIVSEELTTVGSGNKAKS